MKSKWLAWLAPGLFALMVAGSFAPKKPVGPFDANAFGAIPVLQGGRVKPLDTVARSSLLIIYGKQQLRTPDGTLSADEWLLKTVYLPDQADELKIFRIDNPDVLGALHLTPGKERYFKFAELVPHLDELNHQAEQIRPVKTEQRSPYQTALFNLSNNVYLYQKLQNTLARAGKTDVEKTYRESHARMQAAMAAHFKNPGKLPPNVDALQADLADYQMMSQHGEFLAIFDLRAPLDVHAWRNVGQWMLTSFREQSLHPSLIVWARLGDNARAGDAAEFNKTLQAYHAWIQPALGPALKRVHAEVLFNRAQPFYQAMLIYLGVFLLVMVAWLTGNATLQKSAFVTAWLAFAVHTVGLITRMILQGRPPVTNLYSSAIFVGWVAVLLGLLLEKYSRKGLGSIVSSIIGFITLIIAHHLATQGDTLEMMRAVLDSNFWLATHVTTITIGYSSTFLSGTFGIIFIFRRLFDRGFDEKAQQHLDQMTYGVVCFSALMSFIGTVLGGIWADQSWGRFWGWDPKENGALLIVLWNALILHARWGKIAGRRGVAALAVFGNIVTSLSWFGVNMLGIGLHSYGFMDKAFIWLVAFVTTQAIIIGLAYVPRKETLPN